MDGFPHGGKPFFMGFVHRNSQRNGLSGRVARESGPEDRSRQQKTGSREQTDNNRKQTEWL